MSFTLALPVALSAIQSLIKFRGRLDTILSINQTTAALPFSLPPAPKDHAPHVDPMLVFFGREVGANILTIRGLNSHWDAVRPDPFAEHVQRDLSLLLEAYYEACDIVPQTVGPGGSDDRFHVAKGPSKEMRLAYYVVESDRLSRNPAVTRVLLAAADTLLEFGASNAGLFVSNPRTRSVLESLLTEFAIKRDWDEAGDGRVFKLLLGSAAAAALENRSSFPDKPVLNVLFAALAELMPTDGTDFVAKLITRDGFQALVSRCLTQAASEPALLPDQTLLRDSLAAMLRAAGKNLDGILNEPGTLAGVLEAGICAAATSAAPLVDQRVSGQPLLAAVLKSSLDQTQKAAANHELFEKLGGGNLFPSLYKVVLRSVAGNPGALASQTGLDAHVAAVISGCIAEIASGTLGQSLPPVTLRSLAVRALDALSEQPEVLGVRSELGTKIVGAALISSARAAKNGFRTEDLLEITEVVVHTAATNLSLVDLDERLRPVVLAFSHTLSETGLSAVTTTAGRKGMFFAALNALTANPKIWGEFAQKDLVEPLVTGVIRALSTNAGSLLSGPALVPAFQQTLEAAARRGRTLTNKETTPAALEAVLLAAVQGAEDAVGESIDGKTLPEFLGSVVLSFLSAPFEVNVQAKLEEWIEAQLQQLPAAV